MDLSVDGANDIATSNRWFDKDLALGYCGAAWIDLNDDSAWFSLKLGVEGLLEPLDARIVIEAHEANDLGCHRPGRVDAQRLIAIEHLGDLRLRPSSGGLELVRLFNRLLDLDLHCRVDPHRYLCIPPLSDLTLRELPGEFLLGLWGERSKDGRCRLRIVEQHGVDYDVEPVDRHRQLDSVPVIDGAAGRVYRPFPDPLVEAVLGVRHCLGSLEIEQAVANATPREQEHEPDKKEAEIASLPYLSVHLATMTDVALTALIRPVRERATPIRESGHQLRVASTRSSIWWQGGRGRCVLLRGRFAAGP